MQQRLHLVHCLLHFASLLRTLTLIVGAANLDRPSDHSESYWKAIHFFRTRVRAL
ncbi:hypothetical protein BDP27DRAFT_1337248 [Rhodocollybia butyracea]|uniref:Uncharacterized protein n=1 Tax=Rhodocollybia butyracea TaxID=206335 RepID=A0A9P5U110_9AGAR|nr:hypothetical protein BDP27DRAFT_1337248 [Rhodocollybia butyracea]